MSSVMPLQKAETPGPASVRHPAYESAAEPASIPDPQVNAASASVPHNNIAGGPSSAQTNGAALALAVGTICATNDGWNRHTALKLA